MELSEEIVFLNQERQELLADLSEAVSLVKMAEILLNDPEDRLGLRGVWGEKAVEVWTKYYGRITDEPVVISEEARDSDWIGD